MGKDENTEHVKLYYSISEVSEIVQLPISHIRYYENIFADLKVRKDPKGNRMFTKDNINDLKKIIHLTKNEGYTLEGAKKILKNSIQKSNISNKELEFLQSLKIRLENFKSKLT